MASMDEMVKERTLTQLQRIIEDATLPEALQEFSDEKLNFAKEHVNSDNPKIRSRAKYVIALYAKHDRHELSKDRVKIVEHNKDGKVIRRRTCSRTDLDHFLMQGYELDEPKPEPKRRVKKDEPAGDE